MNNGTIKHGLRKNLPLGTIYNSQAAAIIVAVRGLFLFIFPAPYNFGGFRLVNILDIPFIHCFGNAVRNLYFRFYKYGRRRAFARDEQLPIQNRLSCGVLLDVLENGVLFLLLHLLSHA